MNKFENDIRKDAHALHTAITEAKLAGMVVVWPHNHDGLTSIAISDTAKSLAITAVEKPKAKPKPIGSGKSN